MKHSWLSPSFSAQLILALVVLILLTTFSAGIPAYLLTRSALEQQAWSQVEGGRRATRSLLAAEEERLASLVALFAERPTLQRLVLEEAGGGAFMMAVKTKAVLIPAAIWGTDLKRHPGWPKVRILFGKPLEYDAAGGIGRVNLEAIGEEWRRRVLELQRQIVPPEERERFEALTAAVEAAHQKRLKRLAERETKKRNPEQQ